MLFTEWLQIATVCLLGAMSPGPSLAVIIRNSVKFNRFAGISASIGHGIGIFLYAALAIAGLGILIQTYVNLFFIIKFFGSLCLIFIGLLFFFKSNQGKYVKQDAISSSAFIQGFLISIFNPKILIWFTAIFSHFIEINSNFSRSLILSTTAGVIDIVWYVFVSIVVTSFGLKNFFEKNKKIIEKICGFLIILIATILLINLFLD
ncbi:MAG: Leucine efflux protein [Alphaproteobacteria bacterium MarineAlpha5_Bin9]|nr:MAG: Leucine efflux protein [Alphaproteobacteria bacterium MarineAlpha5_Bin9]|tara:strand:- start:31201 stop:31815 length:615 start_codon:yes stop_codon:yes gene_type:complete